MKYSTEAANILIALIFMIGGRSVLAQENGKLQGQIFDLTETGIPWAKVTVRNDRQYYEIKTDKDGKYELTLAAGDYLLIVRADGFLPSRERRIKIITGQTTETSVIMSITREPVIGCFLSVSEEKVEPKKEKKGIQKEKTTKGKPRKIQSRTSP